MPISTCLPPDFPIAIVHDWIFERRGGEKVLECLLELFPQAHLFYLFGNPEEVLKLSHKPTCFPSFLNQLPGIKKFYKHLLPLLPVAIESFNLTNYKLVISTSSCVAKGVIPSPLAKHLSYIHSPMRYAWDQEHHYFPHNPSFQRPFEIFRRLLLSRLRQWDVTSSHRIDQIIANSSFVSRRCELYYGKKSSVVYPPVDVKNFFLEAPLTPKPKKVLLFGAWVPYKKMTKALECLLEQQIPVIAAGQGKELIQAYKKYKHKAEFVIQPKDHELNSLFSKAHVLLFPALEDFGIVPLEATASGLWVVAPSEGGTKDTVIPGVNGFTFTLGNESEMISMVKKALNETISNEQYETMKNHASSFSKDVFQKKIKEQIMILINK